jgi:hypothetical protein
MRESDANVGFDSECARTEDNQVDGDRSPTAVQSVVFDGADTWKMSEDFGQVNWGEGSWGRCSC